MAASLFLLNEIMKSQKQLKSCFEDIAEGDSAMAVLDASKREPMAALIHDGESVAYAHLWETCLISHHYHPSVSKFAAGNIEYTGDPLRDFSLAPFLDKFAYRNPKSSVAKGKHGESCVAERRNNTVERDTTLPVNDPSFLEKQDVDVQDEFFHKFFVERARRDEMKGAVRGSRKAYDEEDEAFDIAENFNTAQTVSICVGGLRLVTRDDACSLFLRSTVSLYCRLKKLGKLIPKRKPLSIRLRKS